MKANIYAERTKFFRSLENLYLYGKLQQSTLAKKATQSCGKQLHCYDNSLI